jgi:hypothetical protein
VCVCVESLTTQTYHSVFQLPYTILVAEVLPKTSFKQDALYNVLVSLYGLHWATSHRTSRLEDRLLVHLILRLQCVSLSVLKFRHVLMVGGSIIGDFERYVIEGSGGGHLSPWGPVGELGGGISSPGTLRGR